MGQADRVWKQIRSATRISGSDYAIFVGDALSVLSGLPSESVHTCLTSPPYWGARDYGNSKQIGLEESLDDYIENLVLVFRELRRVLVKTGTIWLNIGDSYFHGGITVAGKSPAKGWKRNKQLTLTPFRVALALEEDGWWIRNTAVWHKPNAMPSSVKDRLTNCWEPLFLLTKSDRYFFDLDSIRVPHRTDDRVEWQRALRGVTNGKAKGQKNLRVWLNSPRHRATIEGMRNIRRRPNAPNSIELARYLREAIEKKGVSINWVAKELNLPFERTRHYFRTDEIGSRLPPEETWERLKDLLDLGDDFDEAMEVEVGDNVFRNHPKGRNPGDLFSVAVSSGSSQHFATMPVSLARTTLRATLPPTGICIDPFMGTGTTGVAALELGGRFVGIELLKEFAQEFVGNVVGKLNFAIR